jgi:hypothetical protein
MKKPPLFACCLLLIANCFGQSFNWEWARIGKAYYQEGLSVACNPHAGIYLAGYYGGTAVLGDDTLQAPNNTFFCIARYDTAGNVKWARTELPGAIGFSEAYGVATDASGNAYLTGYYTDTLYIATVALPSNNNTTVFTAKYDTAGVLQWAHNATGRAIANGLATDINNNVYIIGYFFPDSLYFGTSLLLSAGNQDIYFAKYDSNGNFLWAQSAGGNSFDYGQAVATDSAGNFYITGEMWSDTFKIGDSTLYYNYSNRTGQFIFTAKFTASGNLVWVNASSGLNEAALARSVAVDGNNNVYVTGRFIDSIAFGAVTLYATQPNAAIFLVKYDSLGNVLWAKASGGNCYDQGWGLAIDINNNIYVSGGFWDANALVDSFQFDTTLLVGLNPADPMFLMKLDGNGNVKQAQSFASGGDDASALCVDRFGNGYIVGDFEVVDSIVLGNDTLRITGEEDIFIAKFISAIQQCNLSPPLIAASDTAICASDSAHICAPPGFVAYRWNNSDTSACFYTNLAGNYYVTVTDHNNCSATSNAITLTVNTPPQVSITVNHDTLSANNGDGFQWYLNGSPLPGDTSNQIIASKGGEYSVLITDSNGCSAASNPVNVTGINSLTDNAISIYPNPSNANWQLVPIAIGSNNLIGATLEVWDNEGQIIYESKITSVVTEINLPALASGVYYLRVNTGEGVVVRKLLKF